MNDKIDLLNRLPAVPMQLPKMKTLCCDPTEQEFKDADPNYTNPNLYNYGNQMETKTLDV